VNDFGFLSRLRFDGDLAEGKLMTQVLCEITAI
jgi:hypothetical protein